MPEQRVSPAVDALPVADHVTEYDLEHAILYLRLLDGMAAGADPAELAKVILRCDPNWTGIAYFGY